MSRPTLVGYAAGSVTRVESTGNGAAGRSSFGARLVGAVLHATLWVSPYPMARAVRRQFAASGAATNRALEERAPAEVEWLSLIHI